MGQNENLVVIPRILHCISSKPRIQPLESKSNLVAIFISMNGASFQNFIQIEAMFDRPKCKFSHGDPTGSSLHLLPSMFFSFGFSPNLLSLSLSLSLFSLARKWFSPVSFLCFFCFYTPPLPCTRLIY